MAETVEDRILAQTKSMQAAVDAACAEMDRLRAINRELLEALEALLDVSDFATNARMGEIHLRAMAAIRKAKGEN